MLGGRIALCTAPRIFFLPFLQMKAGETFAISIINAYVSEKFAAMFDSATDWLSKLVLPAISTIVDELTSAGFFYSEIFGAVDICHN